MNAFAELDPPEQLRSAVLIPLLVLAAWWPLATYWQSDDFIAIHYAVDFGRALGDFTHNQYDLEGVVWFYRPLITLSFAIDMLLGGANPFFSHLSNAVAHSISAFLVAKIALRFLGPVRGFCAGLLWGLAPSHIGSIQWAVGRVDSHTCVWIFLAVLLCLRGLEGSRRDRWLSMGAFIFALGSKELAWVLPGIIAVLSFSLMRRDGAALRECFHRSYRTTLPFALLLLAYFPLRYLALDRLIGGYQSGDLDITASLVGLGTTIGQLVDPMLYAPGRAVAAEYFELPTWAHWLIAVPILWTGYQIVSKRAFEHALAGLLLFLGCAIPVYQFWSDVGNGLNLRYYYLAFAACAGLLAIGGRTTLVLVLACWYLPFVQLRQEYQQQCAVNRAVHTRILEAAADIAAPNLFVSGIPVTSPNGLVMGIHYGVDRLLREPFVDSEQHLFALRPLGQQLDVNRLPYGDAEGLPFGVTLQLTDPTIIGRLSNTTLPDLEVRLDGPTVIDKATVRALLDGEHSLHLVTPGVHADRYRITLFTACGYLTFFASDAAPTAVDGYVDLFRELSTSARYTQSDDYTGFALIIPCSLDLVARFPVLVEAGTIVQTLAGEQFAVQAANRQPVWLEFGRDYGQ